MFKIGPQNLPASLMLLGLALAAHTVTEILGLSYFLPRAQALLAGITTTLLLCALTTGVMLTLGRQLRLVQTLTALAGAIAVLGVIGIPITGWWKSMQAAGGLVELPIMLLVALTGWGLTVQGHILRHALSLPLFVGLVISILFFFVSVYVMESLFPPPVVGA